MSEFNEKKAIASENTAENTAVKPSDGNKTTDKKASPKRMNNRQRKLFNAVFIVIFLFIFAGVNVLAIFLVNKFPSLEVDLTSKGSYTLQASSLEYFNYLEDEITIKVLMSEEQLLSFADDNGSTTYAYQVNQLLREMSQYDNVTLEYMELTATSGSALSSRYPNVDWTSTDNLIIVETAAGDKYKVLTASDVFSYNAEYAYSYGMSVMDGQYLEQEVLAAIQRVTSDKVVRVALSVGNGEVVTESSKEYNYYTYLPVILDDNAYDVETVNLMTQEPSADTDIIMMVAPSYDLTDSAVDALSKWIQNDGNYGKTFFYVPYEYADETPNIDLFLEQWGMSVMDGYINENDETMTVASANPKELNSFMNYVEGEYTENLLDMGKLVLMQYCSPVEILDDTMATPLLQSSDKASIRVSALSEDATEVEYIDSTGEPLTAAAISTKTNDNEQSSSVVLWGSAYALDSYNIYTYSGYYNNATYLINMLNTLSHNETETIVIEGVPIDSDYMVVTSAQQVVVFVLFVILVPIAVIVLGIVRWAKRRNR